MSSSTIETAPVEASAVEASPAEAIVQPSSFSEIPVPKVERVSVTSEGAEVLGFASSASLSGDGRFVAFSHTSDDLVTGDANQASDIFVRDRLAGLTERISIFENGPFENGPSFNPSLSDEGRFVAFQSLLADVSSVFVYDRDADANAMEQVSVSEAGEVANGAASEADISADGRFVAFQSEADNLVADDTNGVSDVFVRDRQLNTLERVSLAADGTEGDGASTQAALSADGRYVAFVSDASNLVENDTNETADVFVYDRETQLVERVSLADDGTESNGFSRAPSISADGRYVSYDSFATNLAEGDTNRKGDVFVYDRLLQTTERVSVASEGEQSNNFSFNHDISADGRYVTYSSVATNLVADDTNRAQDVFVFDREMETTERLSVNAEGVQGNRESRASVFSSDGRFVAFQSSADELVADDTNGRTDIFVYDFKPQPVMEPSVSPVPPVPAGADAVIDLTGVDAPTVTASMEVTRSAGYNNTVGWYVVEDEAGSVRDELTGEVLMPGDAGYEKAAIAQRLDVNLTGLNHEVVSYEFEIATGDFLSTFIISNGTVEALLDADTQNDPNIFFGHLGANSDRTEHVQLLEENTFGYEDLLGGGDKDFNDMVVQISFV